MGVSNMDPKATSQQISIEFLDNELDLCQTFLDTALIDADDAPAAAQGRANAQAGYETASEWLASIRDPREFDRLTSKLHKLKQRIDSFDT
jgi:hypothetical protein